MPASTTDKGLKYGWNVGEGGWKPGMDENMLRIDALLRTAWGQNRATTVGLNYGYYGDMLLIADVWTRVADGTVLLADADVNYVEFDGNTGIVTANVVGFSSDKAPMAQVTTLAGAVTEVVDARSELPGAQILIDLVLAAVADLLPLMDSGAPVDGVTGVGVTSRQYIDEDTGILYLNQGSLAVPAWHGVINT